RSLLDDLPLLCRTLCSKRRSGKTHSLVRAAKTERDHKPCHLLAAPADATALAGDPLRCRTDQRRSALPARLRIATATPLPDAGVGFLYVSSSPLIVMKRF